MKKFWDIFGKISIFKTVYFNLKYFPLGQALRLPVFISSNVHFLKTSGTIVIPENAKTGNIKIGFGNIGIFDRKRSRAILQISGKVIFKGKANIGHGSKISVGKNALLEIGENFVVTAETQIVAQKQITFGHTCLISWDCLIMDTDFHKIYDKTDTQINPNKPIIIGNNVWIGCRNLILKGAVIPDNSIIGANSSVTNDISGEEGLFAGQPIKLIKKDVYWRH